VHQEHWHPGILHIPLAEAFAEWSPKHAVQHSIIKLSS